jgi:uncharacterized protein (DUF427 family)
MLKNYNHDLIHSLSEKLDAVWRYQKEYLKNAEACKDCVALWKKLMADDEKHIEMLKEEISRHIKENRFD